MTLRLACAALILAFSVTAATAADDAAPPDAAAEASGDVQRMTPAQLRAAKTRLDREIAAKRDENTEARQRIETLEQRNAELAAKKAELDARLAEVQAKLAQLEAARGE